MHLAQRDVTFVCVSRAPYDKLAAYREPMRWSFAWFSSAPSTFNEDVGVTTPAGDEIPGISAFARAGDAVLHTYFTTSRGLDAINPAYQLLDLTPKGRDEGELEWPMAWLRRHDAYNPGTRRREPAKIFA